MLYERKPETADWHFSLAVHSPGLPKVYAIEHGIGPDKCFVLSDMREPKEGVDKIVISADLIAAAHEEDAQKLEAEVLSIAGEVDRPNRDKVLSGTFQNCFDFVAVAVGKLHEKGYLSEPDAKKFTDYHAAHAADVKKYTDENTKKLCARNGTGCKGKPSKPAAKKATGKKHDGKA